MPTSTGMNKEYYIASARQDLRAAAASCLSMDCGGRDVLSRIVGQAGDLSDIYQIRRYKSVGDMFTKKEIDTRRQ